MPNDLPNQRSVSLRGSVLECGTSAGGVSDNLGDRVADFLARKRGSIDHAGRQADELRVAERQFHELRDRRFGSPLGTWWKRSMVSYATSFSKRKRPRR